MHHSDYYFVSLIFGTTIPTSFNILVKCFLHLYIRVQWNLRTKVTPGDEPFGLCREVGPCLEVVCKHTKFDVFYIFDILKSEYTSKKVNAW